MSRLQIDVELLLTIDLNEYNDIIWKMLDEKFG